MLVTPDNWKYHNVLNWDEVMSVVRGVINQLGMRTNLTAEYWNNKGNVQLRVTLLAANS